MSVTNTDASTVLAAEETSLSRGSPPAARTLLGAALSSVVVALSLVVAPPAAATVSQEWAAVAKINASRKYRCLRPLVVHTDLRRLARRHSAAMASRHRLYHSNLHRVPRARTAAENVAYGSSVRQIHRMLMRSPPHRRNILNPRMRHVGVAVTRGRGHLWVTQIFRQPL